MPVLTSYLESLLFFLQLYLLRIVQRFLNGKRLIGIDFESSIFILKIRNLLGGRWVEGGVSQRNNSIRSSSSSNARFSGYRLPEIVDGGVGEVQIRTAGF